MCQRSGRSELAKILVAGEDLDYIGILESSIESEGHYVVLATSGYEALEEVAAEQPDMVLLEAHLSVFNGFEACQMLREDPEIAKDLPIIIIDSENVDVRRLEAVGATGQLSKSAVSSDIRDMLVKYLGDKGAGNSP